MSHPLQNQGEAFTIASIPDAKGPCKIFSPNIARVVARDVPGGKEKEGTCQLRTIFYR